MQSVCLSVCEHNYWTCAKIISWFYRTLVLWLGLCCSRKNWLTFSGDPDHFSTFFTIAEYRILWDLLAFIIQSPLVFTTLSEMTDVDKIMYPQHFWSDPAGIRIGICINPEIMLRIPDNFRLRLDALAEVCALRAQSSHHYFIYLFYFICFSQTALHSI